MVITITARISSSMVNTPTVHPIPKYLQALKPVRTAVRKRNELTYIHDNLYHGADAVASFIPTAPRRY
jgi:hypothetical protein